MRIRSYNHFDDLPNSITSKVDELPIYQKMYETGIANGALYFDFVGARKKPDPESKLYRIQQFKKHMGGQEAWGYLWRYVINKHKYYLYTFLLKVYCRVKNKRFGNIIYSETGR